MQNEEIDQQVKEKNVQQDDVESQKAETQNLTPEQIQAERDKYLSLTEKFKKEAETYRKKNAELRKAEEEAEKKRMEEQGMYKEMYEKEKSQKDAIINAAKTGTRKSALKEELLKEGINDKYLPVMMKQIDLDKIGLDEELNVDMEQVKFQVTQIKNEYIDLFKKEVTIKDGTPQQTAKNMSYAEELKTATTQKELDAIRKKHGRA